MRTIVPALLIALAAHTAAAQGVDIISTARMRHVSDSLPSGASVTAQLGGIGGLKWQITQRDSSGSPERHENFSDIFVIQRGSATLRWGGNLVGAQDAQHGEWRNGTIEGGTESRLEPGDIVIIPAGVPHQTLLRGREKLVYFVFKVEKH